MVAFARARTKALLLKLCVTTTESMKEDNLDLRKVSDCHSKQNDKNSHFFEVIKNGGMWFS